jgi:hypothetical protein
VALHRRHERCAEGLVLADAQHLRARFGVRGQGAREGEQHGRAQQRAQHRLLAVAAQRDHQGVQQRRRRVARSGHKGRRVVGVSQPLERRQKGEKLTLVARMLQQQLRQAFNVASRLGDANGGGRGVRHGRGTERRGMGGPACAHHFRR